MLRTLAVLAFATVAVASQAALNLNIDNPDQSVNLPTSGNVTLTFSGSIVCSADWKPNGNGFLTFPSLQNSTTQLTNVSYDNNLLTYISSANFGDDYTGDLFTVTGASTDVAGYYGYYVNSSDAAYFQIDGVNTGGGTFKDTESFSVTVNSVPEPASMAILGLGVAAFLRKRKK